MLRMRTNRRLSTAFLVVGLVTTAGITSQFVTAEVQNCHEESNGDEACKNCADSGNVSWKCSAPFPQDEFCQASLIDDTACIESEADCPGTGIIWTSGDCDLGSGTSHTTTTACGDTQAELIYTAATSVTHTEDCDGSEEE